MTDSKTDERGALFVTADTEDPRFNQPYIDVREWRDEPPDVPVFPGTITTQHGGAAPVKARHLYIHGGFTGTDARFSFCLPPEAEYQGRFFQATHQLLAGEEATPRTRGGLGVPLSPFCEENRPVTLPAETDPVIYLRANVTWVTPIGELTASTLKRSSSSWSPSHRRSPRARTIGTIAMCMWSIRSAARNSRIVDGPPPIRTSLTRGGRGLTVHMVNHVGRDVGRTCLVRFRRRRDTRTKPCAGAWPPGPFHDGGPRRVLSAKGRSDQTHGGVQAARQP